MATREQFRSAASSLQRIARQYHGFQEDPGSFLQHVHEMEPSVLREYLEKAKDIQVKTLENVEQIRPVIFLRRIIVERILDGESISESEIQELQDRIDERDTEYFSGYPELHDEIANQKERTNSAFNSWDLFKILFGIDYHQRSEQVKLWLQDVAEFLQEELRVSDCDYHTAGFDYNQGFGTDICWVALYPEEAGSHRDSYQIFCNFRASGYEYGLVAGDRLENNIRELEEQPAEEELNVDALLNSLRGKITRFNELNRASTGDREKPDQDPTEDHPLNRILYGPPGTGKTYSVQKRALKIIEGTVQNLSKKEISDRFQDYLDEGRVAFTTFHPSYSYEEFVEGLRYDPEEGIPQVQDGILKQLAERAINPRPHPGRKENPTIWKMSLGKKGKDPIFERCIEENEIAIGYLGDVDFGGRDRDSIERIFEERDKEDNTGSIVSVNHFVNNMKDGDYVAVYNDRKSIRAIGVITGPYEHKEDEYDNYPHVRPVEWLDQSVHSVYEMNGATQLDMQTTYPLDRISLEEFLDLLPRHGSDPEPYVLIIDEINRGNLSRIFGELITLLEPDKRKGADNEMSVTLPYSQDSFSLPSNLYVLGTMNTADRSIALVDVALRRRFDFEEMMPNAGVVRDHLADGIDEQDSSVDLTSDQVDLIVQVFKTLNSRISYLLDRDHQIGHSYFMKAESMTDFHEAWYGQILPLLQEYFYNDRTRLVRVLGEHDPDEPKGFVKTSEPVDLLGDGSAPGEAGSWDFHEYGVGRLEAALRNTFPG